jgi:hypothetical protein
MAFSMNSFRLYPAASAAALYLSFFPFRINGERRRNQNKSRSELGGQSNDLKLRDQSLKHKVLGQCALELGEQAASFSK